MRRNILVIFALTIFGISSLPFFAMAADELDKSNYWALRLGAYSPQSEDLEDFDTGFNGEISFGHRLSEHFALEVGLGYFQTEGDESGFDGAVGNWKEDYEVWAIPLSGSMVAILPLGDKVELYGKMGLSAYFINAKADLYTDADGGDSDDGGESAWGPTLGVGCNFNATEKLFIGIDVKYYWATKPDFDFELYGVKDKIEIDIQGVTVNAAIGFRF